MGLDPAEADDVFQITFIRLSQRLSTLKDPSRVRAWLVTTARRVALKALGRVRAEEDSEKILRELTDPAELPVEEIHRLEEQQIVRIALERLPERCRKLLSLLYYPSPGERGPSYDVAARELDLPLGSIGPTRMRCLKKLLVEYRRLVRE
jgi:RNA polymerase sigma factor (sigma-70 family)